ncbi:hypothetical protein AAFX60_006955 [Aliivibrio fischeri]
MDKKTQSTAKIVGGTVLLTFALMAFIHKFQPMDLDHTFGLND